MSLQTSSDKYSPIRYMISNKNLLCDEVSAHLLSIGIPGTVTSHSTIVCDKSRTKCEIENGCTIIIYDTHIEDFLRNIVNPLHKKHSLTCGYVHIDGIYVGCVNNLFRQSKCK